MRDPHVRVVRDDQRESVGNADLAFDSEPGALVREIADQAIEAACLTEAIVPAFSTPRRRLPIQEASVAKFAATQRFTFM